MGGLGVGLGFVAPAVVRDDVAEFLFAHLPVMLCSVFGPRGGFALHWAL